jgi:hypothetical protein
MNDAPTRTAVGGRFPGPRILGPSRTTNGADDYGDNRTVAAPTATGTSGPGRKSQKIARQIPAFASQSTTGGPFAWSPALRGRPSFRIVWVDDEPTGCIETVRRLAERTVRNVSRKERQPKEVPCGTSRVGGTVRLRCWASQRTTRESASWQTSGRAKRSETSRTVRLKGTITLVLVPTIPVRPLHTHKICGAERRHRRVWAQERFCAQTPANRAQSERIWPLSPRS